MSLWPREEFAGVDERADAGCPGRLLVLLLIADDRRGLQVDAMDFSELDDHSALGLAAFAFVRVVMRADLPRGQDSTELAIELHDRGLDFFHREPPALHPGLVGDDEDQMVTHRAQLFRDSRHQLDHDVAIAIERQLAIFVEFYQRACEIAEQPYVSRISSHREFASVFQLREVELWRSSRAPVDVIAHVSEDLVKDRDTRLRLRLGYHQRRINPHAGEISHDDQAALERLFEDELGDVAAQQLAGVAIAHQVQADHEPFAAHVTHEFVFLGELEQPAEHRGADGARIFDQILAPDRLD